MNIPNHLHQEIMAAYAEMLDECRGAAQELCNDAFSQKVKKWEQVFEQALLTPSDTELA
jgi:hypothetical protein